MPKKRIIDSVLDKKTSMKDRAVAGRNQTLAIAAIKGGIRSAEWRAYMMQFVEQNPPGTPVDPRQLDRLLGTDGTMGDPDLDMKRAYLVADGPCGPETRLLFGQFVDTIDVGLDPGCQPADQPAPKTTKKKAKKSPRAKKYPK